MPEVRQSVPHTSRSAHASIGIGLDCNVFNLWQKVGCIRVMEEGKGGASVKVITIANVHEQTRRQAKRRKEQGKQPNKLVNWIRKLVKI